MPDDFPIAEAFGYPPGSDSDQARLARARCWCPFRDGPCTKLDGPAKTGVCSLKYRAAGFTGETIWAVCANRLSGEPFQHAAEHHFGERAAHTDMVMEVRLKNPDLSFDAGRCS